MIGHDLGPSDPGEFERLRELARQRMAAIRAEQERLHADETESAARRPPAVAVVPKCK